MTNCHALKMTAADGKRRLTDVADTEQLLRLIQSVPSPKAEPFKLWLAHMLAETATKDISAATKPTGIQESREVARQGGAVAGNARRELEERTGASVISSANAAQLNDVVTGMITDIAKDPKKD